MRLIDADALMNTIIQKSYTVTDYWNTRDAGMFLFGIEQAINEQPTIDDRKKGKWKVKAINTFELAYGSTGYEPVYECSECGMVEESYLRLDEPIMPDDADFPKYCPNCGAEMDGE